MNFKGKTVEDAITEGLKSLSVSRDEVEITVLQEPVKGLLGLIGNKEAIIDVTLKETSLEELLGDTTTEEAKPIEKVTPIKEKTDTPLTDEDRERKIAKGTNFLKDVLDALDYPVEYFIRDEGELIRIDIRGKNVGNLIGKRGETLYAFQYLINLAANRNDENSLKFIVDIEDFRKRREKTLYNLANRLAKKVVETGKPISLEPMNPLERKVIHMALQDHPKVETISEGSEGQRYIKIVLKETRQ